MVRLNVLHDDARCDRCWCSFGFIFAPFGFKAIKYGCSAQRTETYCDAACTFCLDRCGFYGHLFGICAQIIRFTFYFECTTQHQRILDCRRYFFSSFNAVVAKQQRKQIHRSIDYMNCGRCYGEASCNKNTCTFECRFLISCYF